MVVFFLHIPKTAGSTFHRLASAQFTPDRIVRLPDDARDHQDLGRHLGGLRRWYRRPAYVSGHVSIDAARKYCPNAEVVTFVRDPVERLVSHYFYVQRHPSNPAAEAIGRGMSLESYAAEPPIPSVENGLVRYLAGGLAYGTQPMDRAVTEGDTDRAIRNLSTIHVGIVETFSESLRAICATLRWPTEVPDSRENVNQRRPLVESLPAETIAVLREATRHDRRLYESAVAISAHERVQER